LKSNRHTTSVKLARFGSSLKNQPYEFTNFLQNINSNINSTILSLLNLLLFIEFTIACCRGIYWGWTIGKTSFLIKIASAMLRNKTLSNTIL